MSVVKKSVLVPYSANDMFNLVSNVPQYPEFLPWCSGSQMIPQADGSLLARVDIHFKGIRQSFTTRNLHEPGQRIAMQLHEGPFQSLQGEWQFHAITEQACRIEFYLEYHFASGLLERVVRPVFDQIAASFVDAFVKQAELRHRLPPA